MVLGPMESIYPIPGPSQLPSITGTTPGLLDPSQPSRLLRFSNSTLSFAVFDPLTASASQDTPNVRNLSLDDSHYRPKRIVVETIPNGERFWRFVPKARMEDGVQDEGTWPRIVEICGQLVECSQDQWDIYKLDQEYECLVREPPKLSIISRMPPKPPRQPHASPKTFSKRDISPSPERATKKRSQGVSIADEFTDDEEDEVQDMVVDDPPPRGRNERSKTMRANIDKQRKERWEKIERAKEKYESKNGMTNESPQAGSSPFHSKSVPPESTGKRKAPIFEPQQEPGSQTAGDEEWMSPDRPKRTRTGSPLSTRRDLEEKRNEREKRKRERWDQRLDERRQQRERQFMEDVLKEVPDMETRWNDVDDEVPGQETQSQDFPASDEEDEERERRRRREAARAEAIEESRRKLAELEADRPIWEEVGRKRVERERAEQAERRAREERRREAARRAEAERKLREEREARRQEEEKKREREERARGKPRWSSGAWTPQRALERYRILCETFDDTKFSPSEPLTFDAVPWPVLHSPVSFTIEDIDWAAVERFFEAVRPHMRPQDYKLFVQSSQRRFHPDRWRARGLLRSIADDTERGCLEVASNAVAQALTPIWLEVRGY